MTSNIPDVYHRNLPAPNLLAILQMAPNLSEVLQMSPNLPTVL